jgi:hypothetical protein
MLSFWPISDGCQHARVRPRGPSSLLGIFGALRGFAPWRFWRASVFHAPRLSYVLLLWPMVVSTHARTLRAFLPSLAFLARSAVPFPPSAPALARALALARARALALALALTQPAAPAWTPFPLGTPSCSTGATTGTHWTTGQPGVVARRGTDC